MGKDGPQGGPGDKPGQAAPSALLRATRLLAGLYRQLSGLEPYRRANPADGGPEHGQFRKFINEFMALVGAKVNDATVREAKRLAMAENEKGGAR